MSSVTKDQPQGHKVRLGWSRISRTFICRIWLETLTEYTDFIIDNECVSVTRESESCFHLRPLGSCIVSHSHRVGFCFWLSFVFVALFLSVCLSGSALSFCMVYSAMFALGIHDNGHTRCMSKHNQQETKVLQKIQRGLTVLSLSQGRMEQFFFVMTMTVEAIFSLVLTRWEPYMLFQCDTAVDLFLKKHNVGKLKNIHYHCNILDWKVGVKSGESLGCISR